MAKFGKGQKVRHDVHPRVLPAHLVDLVFVDLVGWIDDLVIGKSLPDERQAGRFKCGSVGIDRVGKVQQSFHVFLLEDDLVLMLAREFFYATLLA